MSTVGVKNMRQYDSVMKLWLSKQMKADAKRRAASLYSLGRQSNPGLTEYVRNLIEKDLRKLK